jgi:putative flippase GtrA
MVLAIIIVNVVLKFVLRKIIKFEKRRDKTEQVVSTTFLLFVVTFFNTAVLLLIVNMNIRGLGLPENFPIFSGDFDDFNVGWYGTIGTSILMTMIIGVF